LARAKNTMRAEARRRARAAQRSEHESAELEATQTEAAPAEAPRRQPFFNPPRFREDLRLLPRILTSRRLLILPPLMLLLGFVLVAVGDQLPESVGGLPVSDGVAFYVQLFFLPPALLTFFIAGFLAPRASYLVGALLGILSGVLWSILVLSGAGLPTDPSLPEQQADPLYTVVFLFALNVGYGTFAAAFAAWYRDFLRRMQEQGRARRAEREAKERAKRREARQEDRKSLRRAR
jgi:hypothetical protein